MYDREFTLNFNLVEKMKKMRSISVAIMVTGLIIQATAQVDTSGISGWKPMYNSSATWEAGAFNANELGHPDYGWGIYNSLSHDVTGDSIFIVKLLDGSFKQLWIVEKKSIMNRYVFRYADLDGSREQELDIDMNDYSNKLFLNYSLSGDSIANIHPQSIAWDLVLTKFHHTGLDYVVTGFLSNEDVSISVFHAADSAAAAEATIADTTEFITDSIAAIGNSWYELQGMSIVPLDTLVYFVKLASGDIYKLQVTDFESGFSGDGRVGIRKLKVSGTPDTEWRHDTLVMGAFYANEVYYKVDFDTRYQVSRDGWEIGFKTAQFTSSVMANTTMGVEVYTYPLGDTSAWNPATSIGPAREASTGLSIYPVPATDQVFVRHELKTSQPVSISVFDMAGKQVIRRTTERLDGSELRLDISSLSQGVYILRIRNQEVVATGRFTKRN